MLDIMTQRYRPTTGGILDTREGRTFAREYTPVEIIDAVHWLNDRTAGYVPRLGVNRE